jgi:NADPH:quinone reductase-like Zn-dependent oxidoreductase
MATDNDYKRIAGEKNTMVMVDNLDPEEIASDYGNLKLVETEVEEPAEGQALVKIHLRPLHIYDVMNFSGRVPGVPIPYIAGTEGVGTIVKSTTGKFKEGQRVVASWWPKGTWTSYTTIDESSLLAVPEGVSDEAAAQFTINPITLVGLVQTASVPEGKYLLQAAAGSALGLQLVQYAKHIGLETINIVRRPEQVAELKARGATEVIVSTEEDVVQRVKEITNGEGAWAALDPMAGTFTSTMLKSIRAGGTVYVYGVLTSDDATVKVMDMMPQHKGLRGFVERTWVNGDGPEKAQERLEFTLKLLADGVITPLKAVETYKLEDFRAAIQAQQKGPRGGRIFLSSD